MKKILIVEDEVVVREKLVLEIEWSEEIVLIGEARNGRDALNICEETMPDIIFTDIKMPVMDGIRFTELIKEKNPYVKIVLLTAYPDFSYAQKAVEVNADKYLLKYESDSKKINQVIHELAQKIDKKKQDENRKEVLRRILYETGNYKELREYLNKAGVFWPYDLVYLCCVYNISDQDMHRISRQLGEIGFQIDYRWISKYHAVIFCSSQKRDFARIREKIGKIAEENRESLFIDMGTEVSIEKIHESFQKLTQIYELKIFFGNLNRISSRFLDFTKTFEYQQELENIFNVLDKRQYEEASEKITVLLGEQAMQARDKKSLDECLDRLTSRIFEEVSKYNSSVSYSYALELFRKIRECDRMETIISILTNELQKLKRTVGLSRKMCLILNYLDENYQKNISLEELAEKFEWNASYLSQMFRKQLKITYKEYINELKLNKAKELLLEGRMSVEQIAEFVGYQNVNYFYKIFKKKTGKKPREFL